MESFFHPIRFDPMQCDGCMSCMRACPVQAIRIREDRARMLEDRCIDCGECIKICPEGAIVPLTHSVWDLSKFDYTIAVPSPTLYTQFDVPPRVILEALKACGFDDATNVSPACESVAIATELYIVENRGAQPLFSSFCPTVVRLVQEKYPDLMDQMIPLLSPRELAAKDAKERKARLLGLSPEQIGTVYITPCPSKMVSLVDHPGLEHSYLDAALSVKDLYQSLASAITKVQASASLLPEGESAPGVMWSYQGARPRMVPAELCVSVAGLPNVIRILDDVEKGRLRQYALIEAHACPEGCVSGPLVVENPYVARSKAIRLIRSVPEKPVLDRAEVTARYQKGEFRTGRIQTRPLRPLDEDVSKAIAKMKERERLLSELPGIDCGACGSPSCQIFAEDVVLGEARETDCVFVRERIVGERVSELRALITSQTRKEASDGKESPS